MNLSIFQGRVQFPTGGIVRDPAGNSSDSFCGTVFDVLQCDLLHAWKHDVFCRLTRCNSETNSTVWMEEK